MDFNQIEVDTNQNPHQPNSGLEVIPNISLDSHDEIDHVHDEKEDEKAAILRQIGLKVEATLLLLGVASKVLSGCVVQGASSSDVSQTSTPRSSLSQKMPTETSSDSLVSSTPTEEGVYTVDSTALWETSTPTTPPTATPTATEVVEEFDESALDLLNWENWELVEKEELPESEKVRLLEGGKLFAFPYFKEAFTTFSFRNPAILEIDINTNLDVEIAEIRRIKNDRGEELAIGMLSNTFTLNDGCPVLATIVEAQDSNGVAKSFIEESQDLPENDIVVTTLLEDIFRQNDFDSNILTIYRFLKYQDENGVFLPGNQYSLKDIVSPADDFKKLAYYPEKNGYTNTIGWDTFASGIALLLEKNPELGQVIKYKSLSLMLQGPFLSSNVVGGVSVPFAYDFVFEVNKPCYFVVNPLVMPLVDTKESTLESNPELISKNNLIYTMSLVEADKVEVKQSEEIFEIDADTGTISIHKDKKTLMRRYYLTDNPDIHNLTDILYTPVSVYDFK